MRLSSPALLLLLAMPLAAQPLPDLARQQGYVHDRDTTWFIFDAARYGLTAPTRVVVTGAFRNWDQDMNSPAWQLRPMDGTGVWTLAVPNPQYGRIGPSTPFKFRIDDGRWLDPPAGSPNAEGGNLVFLHGVQPPRLRAELRSDDTVWATLTGENVTRPLDAAAWRLTDGQGRPIPVAHVVPNTATETLLVPAQPLDPKRVYYLELPALSLKAHVRRDPWFRTLYSDKPLGANIDDGLTTFRLFSPRADRVRLYLYRHADDPPARAFRVIDLEVDDDGVWEAFVPEDLHGVYYDFTVHGPADPGNYFYETHPVHITDPYARVSLDSFGKARVWRRTTPATPLRNGRPKMEDVIAYEVHVQDFTDLLPVPADLRGTMPAMTMPGLRNRQGQPVGFDHLVGLGVNVVHLMPMQEYLHYPDAEWQAAFRDDPYMQAMQSHLENYDWGYRTTHAFAIESRFRRRGTEHGAERDQFRDLVQAFHDRDIAVIIDLVPNHTGENMDGRHLLFNFNVLDLPYYYRTNDALAHIGPFGNEVKFEDRPMTQRWLFDQCRALIDEFGIDGFRIDLAGQIDQQTLLALRTTLGDDVILYGEPWIPPSDPDVAAHPDWAWYKIDAPITFFQDDTRNSFKGPVSDPQDKRTDRGFAGGNSAERDRVMRGLTNRWPDETHPNLGLGYLDIHDNWALADQFATQDWDGRLGVDEGPFRIAAGLLFTSLGPVVLHGGTEFMRSKGAAPTDKFVRQTASGPIYLKGRGDTYNIRTPNQFVWDNLGQTRPADYRGMLAWWKGLIAFRNSTVGKVFRTPDFPPEDYYRFLTPANAYLLGYVVDERVLVLINTEEHPNTFADVVLPPGRWKQIADGQRIDHVRGVRGPYARLTGGQALTFTLPATTMMIWVRE
jgi:pullulanase/glycogen debranching enzyme